MNKSEILKGASREQKISFLKKLASNRYMLSSEAASREALTFKLQEDGSYQSKNDSRKLSKQDILNWPCRRVTIQLVHTREQVEEKEPADGYVIIPFVEDNLNGLLKEVRTT